jgi:hypothetical protein
MFGRETILNKVAVGGCTDIVDAYDPFGDSSGLALYQLNGNANDVSGNYNGTDVRGLSYVDGVFGQAASFASNGNFNTGYSLSGSYSISLWQKQTASGYYVFLDTNSSGDNGIAFTGIRLNKVEFIDRYGGGANYLIHSVPFTEDNAWHHFVLSFTNDSNCKIYMDGALIMEFDSVLSTFNHTTPLTFGESLRSDFDPLGNQLDQVRIFNEALTPLEVEALYTEELCICDGTVDTLQILGDTSCIATYQLDGNANDLSGNYSGTPTDVSYGVGEFDLAGVFNGSTSNIQLPALGLGGNQSRSVSVWIKVDSLANGDAVFCYGDESVGKGFNFQILSNGSVFLGYYSRDWTTTTTPITTNTWYHIVITYNGGLVQDASNTGIYVDGVSLNKTSTGTFNAVANTTNTSYEIGKRKAFSHFDGSIDQVRIFNKALSSSEVATLYNETACTKAACTGTTNTLDILGDSSCIAAYPLDGSPLDLSGNYNGVQTDVTYPVGKFDLGGSFNGSTSHIDFPSPIPGTNTPASFSCWFKFNSGFSSGVQTIIGAANMTTSAGIITLYIRYASTGNYNIEPARVYNNYLYYTDTANYPTVALSADTWYNVVFTYGASNEAKIYLNGTLVSTTNLTIPSGPATNSNVLALGQYRDNTAQFNGSIDQVRIFNKALSASEVTTLYNETPCN